VKISLNKLAMALLAVSAAGRTAVAQQWIITTADFREQTGMLHSLSADGVGLATDNPSTQPTERIVPLDQFVSVNRPGTSAATSDGFTLLLAGGDRLTGTPGGVSDEQLAWTNPTLGRLTIPLRRLVALGRGENTGAPDSPPKQDIVTLANGDVVSGVLTGCSADTITITTDGGPENIPLASVSRAVFAVTGAAGGVSHGFRVRLTDGSAVSATDVSVSQNRLTLMLDAKPPQTISVDLAQVYGIEQIGGPVLWVSSMTPTENVQVPYFGGSSGGGSWPARFDASVDGSAMQFDGRRFEHGIGVHAYSRLSFAIEPGWVGFRAQYAIDQQSDATRPLADVTVRIRLDGKTVYERPHVRAGALSNVVALELNGAKQLTLEADYGDAGDVQAHLDWIEPVLLRESSPAVAPAASQP